jgi:hypothetical protein
VCGVLNKFKETDKVNYLFLATIFSIAFLSLQPTFSMEYDRYQQLNKATKKVIENKMGEHGDIISALEVVKETNQSYGIDYADYAANLLTDFVKDGDGVEDIDEVIEELKKINANKFNGTISELNQYK